MATSNGKGSKRRPSSISEDELDQRWKSAMQSKKGKKFIVISEDELVRNWDETKIGWDTIKTDGVKS